MSNLAVASVALVVLIDLATGQGPPVFTNYLQQAQDFRPPPMPLRPVASYLAPNGPSAGAPMQGGGAQLMSETEYMKMTKGEEEESEGEKKKKEKEKGAVDGKEKSKEKAYEQSDHETTPTPGVLSTFTNQMTGAWDRISSLGRSKRNTITVANSRHEEKDKQSTLDSYEQLEHKNQGYVYFKVPKYLVCNQ